MVSIAVQRNVFKPFDELDRILSRPLPYHLKALEGDLVFTWIVFCTKPLHHLVPGLDGPKPQGGVPRICSVHPGRGGALSLISQVLPSLRRRISCYKSFSTSAIRATGSSPCPVCLYPKTNSCSSRGTSFLCLRATSFSSTGSDAAGGTLVPLLFLRLRAMLYERTTSSLSFTQSLAESPKCMGPFLTMPKPKQKQGPRAFYLLF